jgi:transposase
MELPADEIALKYKQLWMVEDIFRTMKSILDTRPIYHKCTETIRGHVFCSFLALCLRKELADRLAAGGSALEWKDVVRDLVELQEMHTVFSGKSFILRSQLKGCAHKVLQAAGVAVPPTVREA